MPPRRTYTWPSKNATAVFKHFGKKPNLLFLKDVSINKLQAGVGEGCKTTEAVPPERHLWNRFHDEDEYYFIGDLDSKWTPRMPGLKYRGKWD
jgi:hypothetical protein